ncbi:MAG: MFS transporter [Candidatus Moranbacteria bacterium]|nr:MFS transporter [Candidatus Moranbacteria bacterium]
MQKHKEFLDRKRIRIINLVTMMMGFSQAILAYVMSTYFKKASGTENVGPFYFISYAILLILLLNLHKLVRIMGKINVFILSVFFNIIFIALLANIVPSYLGMFILMLYVISSGLEWVAMDAVLESYSTDGESGRIRGKHLMILNIGFLLGPFISTRLLEQFSFQGVFIFLLFFNSLMFIYTLIKLRGSNEKFEKEIRVRDVIRKVMKRKDLFHIYYISFALEFFYALMVIYTPIYLLDRGLDWNQIGLIFTAMLIPFVIVQYPAGVLADRKWGEKKMLAAAVFFMGIFTLLAFFIHSKSVLIWSLVLFGTRIGAALIEVLRDSYFYRLIDGEDVDLINFFRTSMPIAFILGSVLSFLLLLFFPVKAVFILVAAVSLSALVPALSLKDNRPRK